VIRPVLVLAALVLALGLWSHALAQRAPDAGADAVGPLFPRAEAARLRQQPGLRLELGGATHVYGRVAGEWRCLSFHDAPADGRALQDWIDALVGAEGLVHARSAEEAPAYGINAPDTLRVALQGPRALQDPAGDVQAALALGRAVGGRTTFVRRQGTPEIWAVAGDLRAPAEARLAPGLPPLLAPAVVPAAWLAAAGGVVRLQVRGGAGTFELERRDRPLDPASDRPGTLPWTWVLDPRTEARAVAPEVGQAYAEFVQGCGYVDVLDPARRVELGFVEPAATLTLAGREGGELPLAIGRPMADGRVPLWVAASGTLYLLAPGALELLAPSVERLTEPDGEDPWSAALGGK